MPTTAVPTVTLTDPARLPADATIVVGVLSGPDGPRLADGAHGVDAALNGRLIEAVETAGGTGRAEELTLVPTLGLAPFGLVAAVGLGDAVEPDTLRRGLGVALRRLTAKRKVHVAIDVAGQTLEAVAQGALLGGYTFREYKSTGTPAALRTVSVGAGGTAANRATVRHARAVTDAMNLTRDLVNTPPNDLYPASFAERAVAAADAVGVAAQVLDERALKRGGFGGILGVGAGSVRPPRLVRLTYSPPRARARVALVGKGITFDSGGLNIKTANMAWMKSDMGGAAAVVATTLAAATLNLPVEVIATVPLAENLPSGSSYRPSDVLTLRGGRTVEIADTDAEGRIVLADAIVRAGEDSPDRLIEASTLTGGQIVALGMKIIAAMGEPDFRDQLVAAGQAAGEDVWALPLPADIRGRLDSPVADLQSLTGDRWASSLVGGVFLSDFVPAGVPWVHLDIAGPAFNTGAPHGYTPKGGTGAAVRTILAGLEALAG